MKNNLPLIIFIASSLLFALIFSSCTKDPDNPGNTIQQGDSIIEINAVYGSIPNAGSRFLQIRYNNVINAPINLTITFHLKDGQQHDIPIAISAGHKNLQKWGNGNYLNIWEHNDDNYDSTSTPQPPAPVIDDSWDVDFIAIKSVTCPDKTYGFKVLTGLDEWTTFYHPTDVITSVSFISNNDTIMLSDYALDAGITIRRNNPPGYNFYFFNSQFFMFTAPENYSFQPGTTMDIPILVYHWNGRNLGSQPDDREAASNGSTLKLNITKVTDKFYDATFSGKIWSSRQQDTLFISNGVIQNALLPVKQ